MLTDRLRKAQATWDEMVFIFRLTRTLAENMNPVFKICAGASHSLNASCFSHSEKPIKIGFFYLDKMAGNCHTLEQEH